MIGFYPEIYMILRVFLERFGVCLSCFNDFYMILEYFRTFSNEF